MRSYFLCLPDFPNSPLSPAINKPISSTVVVCASKNIHKLTSVDYGNAIAHHQAPLGQESGVGKK
ncbi:MAG: hypothetical protein RM021_004175 [Nostoc sp. EkiNYC01]|nr:hypothetical protein [Nostoc sp. EkiNYC01]